MTSQAVALMERDRKYRVFVVEDDPGVRSVLVRLLTDWGYETAMASDGVEALERIPGFHPSVVISDLRMPGWTGSNC
jgi:two-component system OmpR family response regulator